MKQTKAQLLARQRFQAQSMRDVFEAARKGVEPFADRIAVRVRENADGSVDGEIRVFLKPGKYARPAYVAIEESTAWPPNQWMSHFLTFDTRKGQEEEHEHYRKRRKHPDTNVVSTYYGRTSLPGGYMAVPRHFAAARQIVERIKNNDRRKVAEIATRLHWNPNDARPKRRY